MKVSLELWTNKVYTDSKVNQCVLTTNTSTHFFKQALNGRSYFCGIGLRGSTYLGLACPIDSTV